MANTIYITAGIPVAKNSGQAPTAGTNTVYVTAGLPPVVIAVAAGGGVNRILGGGILC